MQLNTVEKQEAMRIMIAKFNRGDALSNDELRKLHSFYEQVAVMLDCLGPKFELAWDRVRREFDVLDTFKENRKRRDGRLSGDRKVSKKNKKVKVNRCPNCDADEGVLDEDTGKIECDCCGHFYGWAFKPA